MVRPKAKGRRVSLERLGEMPGLGGRSRGRWRLGAPRMLVAVVFILAVAVVMHYGVVLELMRGRAPLASLESLAGTLLVVAGLTLVAVAYLAQSGRRLAASWQELTIFGGCCLACVAIARVLVAFDPAVAPRWRTLSYLTPLSGFVIFFAVVYGYREAIAASLMPGILVGLTVHSAGVGGAEALPVALVLLCGGLVAALASRRIRKRLTLLHVGLEVGLTHVALMVGFLLLAGQLRFEGGLPGQLLWGLANGLGVGMAMTVSLPVIELVFNVATDIRLLELSDQEQPLLRYLVTLAPSTDNHSRRVALLAEAGAEAIGANSLLCLVASYYHDIGKMVKPECFIENQGGGESPHDQLRPSMSALIIAAHTKDGVELAREANLPPCIIDIVAQHHGTSVIEFFYSRYLQSAGEKPALDEDFFRYPGPRPRTKEAAIVMLADAVEAASRTLTEPLPSRIETLVRKISRAKLLDGQLEECGLTFSELHRVEERFYRILCAMYHGRIEYPQPRAPRPSRPRRLGRIASAVS
ncbi:MAG: HDIG domain-containing metalloprotein [Candidatus Brocadiia bacterium]